MTDQSWIVACLCANWCSTCCAYLDTFKCLAQHFDSHIFIWIDIEDHADITDDLKINDFPTLLIQRGEVVTFFGQVLPEFDIAERLVRSHVNDFDTKMLTKSTPNFQQTSAQSHYSLQTLLRST